MNFIRSATILLFTLSSVPLHADEKNSAATDAEFKKREAALQAEIRAGGLPEWAGEFVYGDGLGINVRMLLAPKGGFVFTSVGCTGLHDLNYGTVEARSGHLILDFELSNTERGYEAIAGDFVPVRWGDRLYLLADRDARGFANAINAGSEPCDGMCSRFLLRAGDAQKPAEGRPDLPPAFARFLLDKPIAARVVKVLEDETKSDANNGFTWHTTKVELDVGSKDGVWEGMAFHDVSSKSSGETFNVVQVGTATSIALSFEPYVDPGTGKKNVASCLSTALNGRCGETVATAR